MFIDCTVRLGIAQLTNEFGHGFNLREGPPCRRRGLCARELRWCFPWTSPGSPPGGYSVASQDPSSMENQCSTIQVYSGQNKSTKLYVMQNFQLFQGRKTNIILMCCANFERLALKFWVILVWQYFSSTFHMNNALWGWLFFLSWLKRGIFFNGLNFYLNRYSLSLWKREDSRKWMRIVLVMKDKLNRQKSAKKSWLSMVNFQAEFHHKLSFFMEFVNHTKRI